MDEDLRQLIDVCIKRVGGNTLWPDGFEPFCLKHGVDRDRLCYLFAKVVAEEFVNGEMSYADGDVAMNQLSGIMDIDLRGFPLEVYLAFDAGEFCRDDDTKGTIPWQKYTLPAVMEALASEGLLPSA
ncbi:hypothetical protein HDC36_004405 [Xanthomonas sp. JAI131]|jgi:hypothetical protein|uniref:hypothetical protein n=1 Tax=Xanthomonas sp. JAI131 TaxID=2723067 RepID=UPI0015CA3925|nr:hypothetical protein [Xanthomonas sp. JAI131]NYF22915.1 hypothetical protein [Xanthomonas sp. JAI131]